MRVASTANWDTPASAGVTGLGRVTEFIIPAKTGALPRRHPSDSWDLMMRVASPANWDTPASAGATGLGRVTDLERHPGWVKEWTEVADRAWGET